MSKINIDDFEVFSENLNIEGKLALAHLQLLDEKIKNLEAKKRACEVAHNASIDAIRQNLCLD